MKSSIALVVASLVLFWAPPVGAHDFKAGTIQITHPWARATPGGAQVAGGYLVIQNSGKEADRLIGGTLAHAGIVEIHEMSMVGDVMKMRQLDKGLEIKPGETVTLKPASYHMMFFGLEQPLKAGDSVDGTLVFEKAGTVRITYKIEPIGAQGSGHAGHGASTPGHDARP